MKISYRYCKQKHKVIEMEYCRKHCQSECPKRITTKHSSNLVIQIDKPIKKLKEL